MINIFYTKIFLTFNINITKRFVEYFKLSESDLTNDSDIFIIRHHKEGLCLKYFIWSRED